MQDQQAIRGWHNKVPKTTREFGPNINWLPYMKFSVIILSFKTNTSVWFKGITRSASPTHAFQ